MTLIINHGVQQFSPPSFVTYLCIFISLSVTQILFPHCGWKVSGMCVMTTCDTVIINHGVQQFSPPSFVTYLCIFISLSMTQILFPHCGWKVSGMCVMTTCDTVIINHGVQQFSPPSFVTYLCIFICDSNSLPTLWVEAQWDVCHDKVGHHDNHGVQQYSIQELLFLLR